MNPADSKALKSKGGRLARQSVRDYLERQINKAVDLGEIRAFQKTLAFVKSAQKRYKDKPGGL